MKVILVFAIITCLFIVGSGQIPNQECINRSRATELASCISQAAAPGARRGSFCGDCATQLISYYRECLNGTGVDAIQSCKKQLG